MNQQINYNFMIPKLILKMIASNKLIRKIQKLQIVCLNREIFFNQKKNKYSIKKKTQKKLKIVLKAFLNIMIYNYLNLLKKIKIVLLKKHKISA